MIGILFKVGGFNSVLFCVVMYLKNRYKCVWMKKINGWMLIILLYIYYLEMM